MTRVEKIVSGGQTGVDRAALEAAADLGIETGGWIPRGRRAEDGRVPERYTGLEECESAAYEIRTELNVRDSDATLVLRVGPPRGGTALTEALAEQLGRPLLSIDLSAASLEQSAERIEAWLSEAAPRVLNVAGPRASEAPDLAASARKILRRVLG